MASLHALWVSSEVLVAYSDPVRTAFGRGKIRMHNSPSVDNGEKKSCWAVHIS